MIDTGSRGRGMPLKSGQTCNPAMRPHSVSHHILTTISPNLQTDTIAPPSPHAENG